MKRPSNGHYTDYGYAVGFGRNEMEFASMEEYLEWLNAQDEDDD